MIKAIVKYVMNKVINNNTEIRLENKDGDGKTNKKKETGTHEDVSLIKINSTFVQTRIWRNSWPVLPIPDKCFSLKNISNINENDLNYLYLKHQSYALRLMKGVPQRSGNVET